MKEDTKTTIKILVIGFTIVGLILFGFYHFLIKESIQKERQVKEWCAEKGINCVFLSTPQCYNDCEKLGLEYFRIESGGFGISNLNCWCKEGNLTKQIW